MHTLSALILDGREQKAMTLLRQGRFSHADLVKRDACNNTPLHWAAKLGCLHIIRYLVNHGAACCKDFKNDASETPYDCALQCALPHDTLSLLKPRSSAAPILPVAAYTQVVPLFLDSY